MNTNTRLTRNRQNPNSGFSVIAARWLSQPSTAASSAVARIRVWLSSAGPGRAPFCTQFIFASVAANPTLIATANMRRTRSARASARARRISWEPASMINAPAWAHLRPFIHGGARPCLAIELLEIAVDAPLAERDAALRGEVGGDARAFSHALVQRYDARHLALEPFHPLGKGVAQPLDDLEQREVHIGQPAAEDIRTAALLQHALEIAHEFRQPVAPEILRGELGGRPLFFVVEIAGDRVVGVVDQHDEIGDGELQLMHPQPPCLVARRQPQPRTEIQQNVGGLADHQLAGAQERRRKGWPFDPVSVDELHHRRHAALAAARHVDIVGAGLLQGQPHELAAALDRRPVVELVAHRSDLTPPLSAAYASTYSAMLVGAGIGCPSAFSPAI